jgi:transcriptional regulator with XRE-family HTH domain
VTPEQEAAVTAARETLGRNVRLLRVARGLSRAQLASAVGVTTAYIGMLENAKRDPTMRTLARLSFVLDCRAASLFSALSVCVLGGDRWLMAPTVLTTSSEEVAGE